MYNGLIRKLSEVCEEIILPTQRLSRPTIERLYNNNPIVTVLDVLGDNENKEQSLIHERQGYVVLDGTPKLIYKNKEGIDNPGIGTGFFAYYTANYHMLNSWFNFHFERKPKVEEEVYDYVVGAGNEDYAFCVLDTTVKKSLLPDMKIVEPFRSDEIPEVDYLKVIKNAKEVHVMDSAFSCLIDRCYPSKANMFSHKYMQWEKQWGGPTMLVGAWNIYLGENPPPEMDFQDYNKTIHKYFGEYNERTNKFGVDLW